jgi:hypothetical protein
VFICVLIYSRSDQTGRALEDVSVKSLFICALIHRDHEFLVGVAPDPYFARLEGSDDVMACLAGVLAGVFVS